MTKYYRFTFPTCEGGTPSTSVGKGYNAMVAFERLGHPSRGFRNVGFEEITEEEYKKEKV